MSAESQFFNVASRVTVLFVGALALPSVGQGQERSLYDRLGGLAPISVVVSDFIDALVPDAMLNANPAIDAARQQVPGPYLKYHVTAMVCEVTGGPCKYTGRLASARITTNGNNTRAAPSRSSAPILEQI